MGSDYVPIRKRKKTKPITDALKDDLRNVKPSSGDDSDTAKGKAARDNMKGGPGWYKKKGKK